VFYGAEIMKIGFLSTYSYPLLGHFISKFNDYGLKIEAIFLDSKDFSIKDRDILKQRTDGNFSTIALESFETLAMPFYFVSDHNGQHCIDIVKSLGIDILINAGTPRIIKEGLLKAPRVGVVNCHPGLLPDFRGCTCVEWAVYFDQQVGNTVHFMDRAIDAGPIILKEGLTFSRNDRYVDLRVKVYKHQIDLLARGVKKVVDEHIVPEALPAQSDGKTHSVMDGAMLQEVILKLEQGRYRFQCD
jgi:methionyl-tRNA formyltransferase